jgi:tyrosyl-tRNA synthetase
MNELGTAGMIRLAAQQTVARMLEREDFAKRYANQQPISIHEFLYPLCQGYDSVAMKADVELGGTDQRFNLLMGRDLQKHYGQSPQCLVMVPLLEGLDGVNKMSKSLGNYIGIAESPKEIFGKTMSVSDTLMWRYFDLLSFRSSAEIAALKAGVENGQNPRDVKVSLALEFVERFHGKRAAEDALADFEARFQKNALPDDIPEVRIAAGEGMAIFQVLKQAGLTATTSEAMRMIEQGAVKLDGERVDDKGLVLKAGTRVVLQVGKRKFAAAVLQ